MAIQQKASSKKPSVNPTKAPSQHTQPSRKGKKAWRKHVDLGEIEAGMEGIREEERMTGSAFHTKSNKDLFAIDSTGDDHVRKSLPKFDSSQLSYRKLLDQRSAIPAVFSRPTSSQKRHGSKITKEDKERMLALGKRKRMGPLGSVMDPTEMGNGSASLDPSHAVKESGTYDVWAGESKAGKDDEFLPVREQKIAVKPPTAKHPRSVIDVPAIQQPHPGTSYKPTKDAHAELIRAAHEKVAVEETEALKNAQMKKAVEATWANRGEQQLGVPAGMTVGDGEDSDSGELAEDEEHQPAQKPSVRKTKQQRRKAEQQKKEKQLQLERAVKKRYLTSIAAARSMSKSIRQDLSAKEQTRLERKASLALKLKMHGLTGQKVGKHRVPEEMPDVQLGEDMSESLRGMKTEGNLFKDRFLSLQRRALIEPRVPVLPKKHKRRTKEVEKHAWKRFQ